MTDNSASEPSDGSLLRRLRKGEQDAATRLYLRYAKRLHGLATAQTGQDLKSRVDAEDIVQSVFRTFFRRAQEGHYEVPDGEEIWKLFLVTRSETPLSFIELPSETRGGPRPWLVLENQLILRLPIRWRRQHCEWSLTRFC